MFWIIAAILLIIALAFVLPSLLKKQSTFHDGRREQNIFIANEQLKELEASLEQGEIDSDTYQASRDELEQSLFSDVSELDDAPIQSGSKSSLISIVFIALLIPVITIPVYLKVGNLPFTKDLDPRKVAATAVPRSPDGTPDIDTMVKGLQKKMEDDPDNAKGWYMLGRSYMVLKRYPDAVKSYERALKLEPKSADIMLSLADSLAMTSSGNISGRPAELINTALEMEPNNLTALWLGGMAARQQGKYITAIQRWRKVLGIVKDPKERQEVNSLITEAVSKLTPAQKDEIGVVPAAATKAVKIDTTPAGSGISVTVNLSEKFKAQAKPTDLVFIYAKAMSGPPMPLAAVRKQVKDLPITVVLNDAMAMMPKLKISAFSEVVVGARVSKTGQPAAQNGDLFSEKKSIKLGDKISIEIDTVVK